jgi:D-amino-acid dehydrogenase
MKIAVIGAGITGITTAYYLAKEGYDVTVLDRESYPAMCTSYANGGQVSVSNSEVWNTWSNVIKGVKWMFKDDAPLLIRPSLDFDKVSWLTKFLYHTATNSYEKNTLETIHMGIESRKLYKEIIENEKIDFDQRYNGILHIYKNQKYFDMAKEAQKLYENTECEWDIVYPAQIKSLDGATQYMKNIVGGVYTKSDFTGDCHKFCFELSKILRTKYKVKFEFVENIIDYTDLIDYDKIVICAGVGSVKLSKRFGDNIPIYPVKGYSITIHNNSETLLPHVSLLDDEAKIVTSTLGNRLRVAGTAEFNGENYDIIKSRIDPLLSWVHKNLPMVNTKDYSSFACLRPMTPNMLPITKRSDNHKNVYYNTGHGHLGWTLAPYTAKKLAKMIDGKNNGTY